MSTENIIFTGVALYMLVMLGVGFYASKRSHTVADFMLAGRGLNLPILAMTVLATWFGGAMMLGGAGAAFDDGMLGVIADPWGGALALVLVGLFFARIASAAVWPGGSTRAVFPAVTVQTNSPVRP